MTNVPDQPGDVRLYAFSTVLTPGQLGEFERLLSSAELTRAARFHFEADRARYVTARGTLRSILGVYLDRPPGEITLVEGRYGKPMVAPGEHEGMHFNLSRARDLCLVAVRLDEEVGVDLEEVRPIDDALTVAGRRFTPAEAAAISAADPDDRMTVFFRYWTAKEAVIKSAGWGLSFPLDFFALSPGPEAGPERVVIDRDGETTIRWLLPVPAPAGFVAAVATGGAEPARLTWSSPPP